GQSDAEGAGGDRPFLDVDMRLHVDLDAEPRRLADQKARRSDPALAEMKVVAHRDAADAEPLDQVMVNEILRRGPGPGLVERHHHRAGKPGSGQKPQFSGLVGEPELRGVRAEKAARVRLGRYPQRGTAMRLPHIEGGRDHGAVAEMDAIEIAHGNDRSLGDRVRRRGIADNNKTRRHFGNLYVGWGGRLTVTWGAQRSQAGPEALSAPAPVAVIFF